ncbi:hypothetical protein FRX31_017798 [Thalictrum thalictroides]|uniref:Transmembrane protein n=1 Tax=Thalictrum thalictroides TaxID=46969 RepID=A0A7J6W8C5_THATH|nr:hypothetical protein FRX31_017798 [Thalictrum thalictroides]
METKSFMAIFLIFCLVLSPTLPSDAARFNQRELLQDDGPICPACVCCPDYIPIPGRCCPCCPEFPPPTANSP